MKLTALTQHEGACYPEALIQSQNPDERLQCVICFQVMTSPVTLLCKSGHTYGQACIKEWIKGKSITTCPYCRETVETWKINEELKKEVKKIKAECGYCKEWEGDLQKLVPHQNNCLGYFSHLEKQLDETVARQIEILDIEINPHLASEHA